MSKLPFFHSCVGWPEHLLSALDYLISEDTLITRKTFRKHVDCDALRRIELDLRYCAHPAEGLTMAGDWHVSYHKCGEIYYFSHSGIEYVFATQDMIEQLEDKILRDEMVAAATFERADAHGHE